MGSRTAVGGGKGLKGLGMALALVSGRSAAPARSISGRQGASSARMPVAIAKNLADRAAPLSRPGAAAVVDQRVVEPQKAVAGDRRHKGDARGGRSSLPVTVFEFPPSRRCGAGRGFRTATSGSGRERHESGEKRRRSQDAPSGEARPCSLSHVEARADAAARETVIGSADARERAMGKTRRRARSATMR